MPNYEYDCPNCDHSFEQQQSIGQRQTALCPKCGCVSGLRMSSFSFTMAERHSKVNPEARPVRG